MSVTLREELRRDGPNVVIGRTVCTSLLHFSNFAGAWFTDPARPTREV